MRRRSYIGAAASAFTLALAGCSAGSSAPDTTTTDRTTTPEYGAWTATTDCDAMHENVVEVEWVRDDLADDYAPIPFGDLTPGERDILETAVAEGGYASCEVSGPFRRFVERVMAHRERQPQTMVHLFYAGDYYGLSVQQGDQVFSSR